MASDQSQAAADAVRSEGAMAQKAYNVGIPALQSQYGYINQSLGEGGEPQYIKDAFQAQRTGVTENALAQGSLADRQSLAAGKRAALGGNASAALGQGIGARLANAMYSSRVEEGLGKVEQTNKLLGMALGTSQQAGNAGVAAGGLQLRGIAGMNPYNTDYATGVGLGALGGTIYGAFNQGQQQPGLIQPLPQSTNYQAYVP